MALNAPAVPILTPELLPKGRATLNHSRQTRLKLRGAGHVGAADNVIVAVGEIGGCLTAGDSLSHKLIVGTSHPVGDPEE